MKCLIYSDVHHGTSIGKLGDSGLDLRIEDSLNVEKEITKYCMDHEIEIVIFAGDRFKSRSPAMWLANVVDEIWMERHKVGIKTFSVVGNHDSYRIVGYGTNYSKLWKEMSNIEIFDKSKIINLLDKKIGFLPWGWELESLKDKVDLLIFHGCITGYKDARGYIPDKEGFDLNLLKKYCKFFVAGHIHSREEIQGDGVYLGSPYQIDILDSGSRRGWLVFDIEDFSYEFVDSNAPELIIMDKVRSISDIDEEKIERNYVFCKVKKGLERECSKKLEDHGARWYQITTVKEKGIFLKGVLEETYAGEDVNKMIKEYVNSRNLSNKSELIEIGFELWKEIKGGEK